MNQKLEHEINELVRLITFEKKLGKTAVTEEEVNFIKSLAGKKRYPRAEYILAKMYIYGCQIKQNKAIGMKYLARSSRHASYDVQLKIAYIYHTLGEQKKEEKTLSRALNYLFVLNY